MRKFRDLLEKFKKEGALISIYIHGDAWRKCVIIEVEDDYFIFKESSSPGYLMALPFSSSTAINFEQKTS